MLPYASYKLEVFTATGGHRDKQLAANYGVSVGVWPERRLLILCSGGTVLSFE